MIVQTLYRVLDMLNAIINYLHPHGSAVAGELREAAEAISRALVELEGGAAKATA